MAKNGRRILPFWQVAWLLFLLFSPLAADLPIGACFKKSRQLVEIKHLKGHLAAVAWYERRGDRWVKVSRLWKAAVGRNGIGDKREGDGKTPKGRFSLRKIYSQTLVPTRLPLFFIGPDHLCIDDPKSRYYGKVVREDEIVGDFSRAVSLRRKDKQYVLFLPLEEGYEGSCIFLHPKRKLTPTGGGIGLPLEAMRRLVGWLDGRKEPVLWIH